MLNYAIIVSKKDIAGMNIREELISKHGFVKLDKYFDNSQIYIRKNVQLFTVEKETLECNFIDKEINADMIIFATRHRSHDARPIFSCHSPGNWGKAEMGGFEKKLSVCPAALLKKAYLILKEELKKSNLPNFDVTLECTHHGPYIEKPCIFIEIGSDESQWRNNEAVKLISSAIIKLVSERLANEKTAIGIGGTHYCTSFNKVIEETDIALGHICPKHSMENLDKEIILSAMERTHPRAELVLLDWKGMGPEKQRVIKVLDDLGIEHKTTKEVRKNDD